MLGRIECDSPTGRRRSSRLPLIVGVEVTPSEIHVEPFHARAVGEAAGRDPRIVAAGDCICTGGVFAGSYACVGAVDKVVPVDVYVPGCPPGPETLLHGILTLHEQIRTGELLSRRAASPTGGAAIELGAAPVPAAG